MDNYLVMEEITKVYDNGIMANDHVNFSARQGEIHAICGENGAGKSTLMKMLFGIEQPDHGQIIIKGQPVQLTSPTKAIEVGIGMVHQHFMLVPSLTVAENVILGIEPTNGLTFDMNKAIEMTEEVCKKYGFDINTNHCSRNICFCNICNIIYTDCMTFTNNCNTVAQFFNFI